MMSSTPYREYKYDCSNESHSHAYLWPVIERTVRSLGVRRVFEIGCGNGWIAHKLHEMGLEVVATDPSASGIAFAKTATGMQSGPRFEQASAYDDLAARFGEFDLVISLEVIEHLYAPRDFMASVRALLRKNGKLLLSTPHHGYWKCLAIALLGRTDSHYSPLSDGGHIKFWSASTLTQLCTESELDVKRIETCGRFPPFGKSMVLLAENG